MSFKKHLTYSVVLTLTCVASFVSSDYGISENNVVHAAEVRNQSAWVGPYIKAMRDGGLLPASLSNTDLTKNITREEFAELMTTYVNKVGGVGKTNPGVKFSDTTNPLVIQSAEMGIVEGMGNNKFAPKQITNREQIATMAYRGEKLVRPNIVTQKNTTLFKDGRQVSEWAKEGVGTMQAEKVIEGVGGGYFKPKDTATREQAIKIVSELAAKRGLVTIDRPVTPSNPTPQNPVSSKPAAGSVPLNKWGIPQNPKPTPKTIAGFTPDFRVRYATNTPAEDFYFTDRLYVPDPILTVPLGTVINLDPNKSELGSGWAIDKYDCQIFPPIDPKNGFEYIKDSKLADTKTTSFVADEPGLWRVYLNVANNYTLRYPDGTASILENWSKNSL